MRAGSASLSALYDRLQSYREELEDYAYKQGFRLPYEQLATVLHEMIHVDSYMHDGFFVDGVYYAPYLDARAWPKLRVGDVAKAVAADERDLIYYAYLIVNPDNGMGNILDELNAYGHVVAFVCHFEKASSRQQIENTTGFLRALEIYLRLVREREPKAYEHLAAQGASRGAIAMIVSRAHDALRWCGVDGIEDGEFRRLMSQPALRSIE